MKLIRIFVVTAIIAGIIGFGAHINRQYKLIKKLCFNVVDYKIQLPKLIDVIADFQNVLIRIIVYVEIKNPSDIDIDINSYDFNIFINRHKITQVKSNIKEHIASNSKTKFNFSFTFKPTKVLKTAISEDIVRGILIDKKKFVLKINGYVSASHGKLITVSDIPVEIETTLEEILTGDSKPC